ncbi:MAG: response regulator [Acidobacteriia bacterium]|nr:response regulator [Terriglobia bacterium]
MPRVLLVDDEPNVRWTMAEFLTRAGYEVLTASDFDSAVAHLEAAASLDVAVFDIILPRKSGIELLKEAHRRDPDLPVIMITADPDLSRVPEIVREGAYDFMAKPVVKNALINAVSRAFEKKRLTDEKRRLEEEIRRHAEHLEGLVADRTRELAEAHNFLNTVLESSTEYAIIAIDTDDRFTLFNRGAELMFGYLAEQALGKEVREIVADAKFGPEDKPLLKCGEEAVATGRHVVEIRLARADGSCFVASVAMTPLRKADGPLLGYLGIIKDLTVEREKEEELRRMQARLAHNEKIAALGRVAAQVAHEVKNPLAGLKLYSLHLKNKVAGQLGPAEMELVEKIVLSIDHLSDTVEKVLDFARPVKLVRQPVDLNGVVNEAFHMLESQMVANKIEKDLSLAGPDAGGMLDETSIRSAVVNLMVNAIQAMPDGGRLHVTTTRSNRQLTLTISDTGCGMSEEQAKNVFEPFYTTKNKGLGLGMPYARKVIEEHGGTIQLKSRLGEGTQTEITLPVEE